MADNRVVTGVDGYQRSEKLEHELNECCHWLIHDPRGATFFTWLKSISINNVLGASVPSTELHYQEGMRMIPALIQQRADAHERRRKLGEKNG